MTGEKYILDCPNCGHVTGYAPSTNEDNQTDTTSPENLIESQALMTSTGPAERIRCPICSLWVEPDRAIPA